MSYLNLVCEYCGWHGTEYEVQYVDVKEDYGDVCCRKCPKCKTIEYDGDKNFQEYKVKEKK